MNFPTWGYWKQPHIKSKYRNYYREGLTEERQLEIVAYVLAGHSHRDTCKVMRCGHSTIRKCLDLHA